MIPVVDLHIAILFFMYNQRFKLRPFQSPWRVKKSFGNQNSGERRQLATNRLKEKLIEKLSIIGRISSIVQAAASPVFLFSPLVVQKPEKVDMNV